MLEKLRRLKLDREAIGPPECPLWYRWTIFPWNDIRHERKDDPIKLMIHHFNPHADERDFHDHPRPFWTFCIAGEYLDIGICPECKGSGKGNRFGRVGNPCLVCHGTGSGIQDVIRPGSLRYRRAGHTHKTYVPKGCWTIVLMGPIRRKWGFQHWNPLKSRFDWWYWRDHQKEFGETIVCQDEG